MSLSKVTPSYPTFRHFIAQLTVRQVRMSVVSAGLLSFFILIAFALHTGFTGLYACATLQLLFILMPLNGLNDVIPYGKKQRSLLLIRLVLGWAAFLVGSYLLLDVWFQTTQISTGNLFAGNFVMIICLNINVLFLESMAQKRIIRLDAKKAGYLWTMVQVLSLLCLGNILLGTVYQNFTLDLFIHIFFSATATLLAVFVAVDAYWRIMDCAAL